MAGDAELEAMSKTFSLLEPLDAEVRKRVMRWVCDRLAIDGIVEANDKKPDSLPRDGERKVREGTLNGVVLALGANSCRTILMAAAAYLTLYRGMEKFTREEWFACAKTARSWKSDYSVSVARDIQRLITAKEVFEKANNVFAIYDNKLKELEGKLAQ